ncbi:hypothetical protein K4F52_003966 [Lecanicillium sp. MT-2017a]|nr:hypothetical protein K4F52_003966 [Lecanicillium sp. MT-2017a]
MADSFASTFNKASHPPSNPEQRFGSHAMNSGPGFIGTDRFQDPHRDDKPRDAGTPTANPPITSSAPAPAPVSDTASAPFISSMDKKEPTADAPKPAGIPGLSEAPKPAEESKPAELPKISELPKPVATTTGTGLPGLSNLSGSSVPKAAEPPKSDGVPSIFGEPKQEPPKAPEPEKKDSLPGLFGAPKQDLPKVAEPPKSDTVSSLFGQPKPSDAPKASDMPGLFGKPKPQEPEKAPESKPADNAGSAGPAHHLPKPVEVISAPETPMDTGTPAGGTPRPELKIASEPLNKPEQPSVTSGVQEPEPTPKTSVADASKTSIPNGSDAKSSTGASPFAFGALQQEEPRAPALATTTAEPKLGEKRKFEDDDKPLEAEAKKPKIDEPPTALGGVNGASSAPASAPAAAPTASAAAAAPAAAAAAPAAPAAAPAAAPKAEPAPAEAAAPAPKKAGRPKKDKKKPAAPVGRTQRKTRSQGPADAAL